MKTQLSTASVKQHLAAIGGLFDYLLTGQVAQFHSAAAVRGPEHIVSEGKAPIMKPHELRQLFTGI